MNSLRPDGGTATADRLPPGQADEFDESTDETINADEPIPFVVAESFEDKLARYQLDREEYERWKAQDRADAAHADDNLKVGETVWVVLALHGRFEVHPATAYERHPTKGWAFNVQYPNRIAFFREVACCGPFWRNGCWCLPGTGQQPVPVEPVRPTRGLEVRTVFHLSATRPNGGSLDEMLAEKNELLHEFSDPDAAADFWKTTKECGQGWVGVVTRKVLGGPARVEERLWDSLHGAYPSPVKVEVKG